MTLLILVAVQSKVLGLWLLDCWYHEFESCRGHGCSSLVFVLCCVGSGLCEELITCLQESNWVVTETFTSRQPRPKLGSYATTKNPFRKLVMTHQTTPCYYLHDHCHEHPKGTV